MKEYQENKKAFEYPKLNLESQMKKVKYEVGLPFTIMISSPKVYFGWEQLGKEDIKNIEELKDK